MRRSRTLSWRPALTAIIQFPHLIRFRLTLWYTGLAALVLAAFVGGVFYEFDQNKYKNLTDSLTETFNRQVSVGLPYYGSGRYAQSAPYEHDYIPVYIKDANAPIQSGDPPMMFIKPDGTPLTDASGNPVTTLPADAKGIFNSQGAQEGRKQATKNANGATTQTDYKGWHFITIPLETEGQRIIAQMAVPLDRVQRQVDDLKRILVYVAGVLLGISAAGGWMLAGRALKPIDDLTRRAQQITVNDLSQRLNLNQEDELGRLAATFDDMIARLQEAFERQKRFTSDASHELRTPLTVMQADLSLALTRPRSAEEYRQTIESMDEEVTRLSAIVSDLLTLTRIDVDPAGIQYQPVALHELLQSLIKRVRVIAADRGITVEGDHLNSVVVVGDPSRLRQLFTNLLDNAVTYTPDGGRVGVTIDALREGAQIRISDTGIGIPGEEQPRIFERFYRTPEARAQNAHGTGLGLSISRSVAHAHHGEITVESVPGEGSTFIVTLPIDAQRHLWRRRVLPSLSIGPLSLR